jgi:hypothetical protein
VASPASERPRMPGGYLEAKLLPWSWAEARLVRSRSGSHHGCAAGTDDLEREQRKISMGYEIYFR